MVPVFWLSTCLLATLAAQEEAACGARGEASRSRPVLQLWPREKAAMRRVKRAWVIPPISLPENHRRLPHLLVQIKSDKQQPGVVVYSIKGPGVDEDPKDIFSIDNRSGKVYLNTVLDREKHDRFRLKAFALDLGGVPLEDPTDLEIVVLDQNDNRPLFQRDVFTGQVVEGAEPGTFVLKAEATDADDPETDNAALRYSILGPEGAGLFAIDELSGEIQVARDGLDREVMGSYNLTLQVADMAGEGLTTTATAAIFVEDVNDHPPEFMSAEFHLEAPENRQGVEVGRLTVQDEDQLGSPNWLAKFTILEGDPRGAFSIRPDPLTNEGVLSLAKALDYEEQSRYELLVSVQNQSPLHPSAPKAAHALARVQLQVVDANEPPFFLDNPCRGRVNEGAAAGTQISLFRARDPDTQQAQQLRFLQASGLASWLQVDPDSGRVEARQQVPPRSTFLDGWYIAHILAVDNGTPPLTATGTLSVEVLEVNDHAPALLPTMGSLCREGGSLVLSATDQDLAPHAGPFRFHFALSSGHNWTLSHPNDTHVLLRPPVDVAEGLHVLPLLVRDSGIPPQVREQLLNVSVCACSRWGTCGAQAEATLGARAGLSLGGLLAILCSALLLLLLVLLVAGLKHSRRQALRKGLLGAWQDDLRDNIVNYDEQGGGEEDQEAYDLSQLRDPDLFRPPTPGGKPLRRREAPHSCALSQQHLQRCPSDIEDFINEGLEAADRDPSVPPYDTALIYDYEGTCSASGSLSSILSSLGDEDQDYDHLHEWGPRFQRLAELYGQ
uniref:Cadherin 15 n=1 Tax=Laticauda laticaudata TaxID=8630 RepID=A0A8C5RAI9_LATLA